MVRRDPETGQYVSDSEHGIDLQYADFEIQTIRSQNVVPAGTTSDDASSRSYEVLGGDLQHDEVAMLANLRAVVATEVTGNPATENQDEAGAVGGKAELGVNITGDERATSDQRDPNYGDEDNPGILSIMTTGSAGVPFVDTSASAGGAGGGGLVDRHQVDFMAMYGAGPYLDKSDDLTTRVETLSQNAVVETTTQAYYQLGWLVVEMENVRPTFGAPR
jgi:hypothetical protein